MLFLLPTLPSASSFRTQPHNLPVTIPHHLHNRSRALLCVYQLHSAAINSLCIHDGFCVTGSDDKQLRVWPMDFSDYLLEVSMGSQAEGAQTLERICAQAMLLSCDLGPKGMQHSSPAAVVVTPAGVVIMCRTQYLCSTITP